MVRIGVKLIIALLLAAKLGLGVSRACLQIVR